MRVVLVMLIWLLDFLLKIILGFLVVFVIWLGYRANTDAAPGFGWALAGGIVGTCIIGFFEGCDFILLGWAKRVAGER